ncbi:M48 family metallopeptidase [Hydrogenophaga palleronii]|uniref:M48 family metallopeptidase n=1 Tax=Hydrogenophaga palleronii TaxID=65655 RepID=UPI000824EB78|nr:M48 family metallopeptidase [Hydrogenophaga palleronii]
MAEAAAPLASLWFDGQSPRPHPVLLQVQGGELLLQVADEVRRYPLAGVRWPERRTHGQRQAELPDGGLIQHANAAEWDAWAQASGLRDSRVVGWMQSWRATGVALAGSVLFLTVAWLWGVPWLSQTLAQQVPLGLEQRIGQQSLQQLDRLFLRPSELPQAQQDAMRQRFAALVDSAHPQGDAPGWQLSFHASPMLGPNAFALPGGYIVMTDELVELLEDQPDAITGVLAHELGHVQYRDGLDMVVRASLISAMVGVVLGDASGFLATVPATLATQAYSRDAERRADAHAARLLHANGIRPAVMATFFERIRDEVENKGRRRNKPGAEVGGKDDDEDREESGDKDKERVSLPIAIGSHPEHAERIRFFREWQSDGAAP